MVREILLLFGLCAISSLSARAQDKVELFGGYSYIRFLSTNLNGWWEPEALLELLGELGGSHILLLFAYVHWQIRGRRCNRIAKLLKRLIVTRRIAYQAASSRDALHAHARRLNQIEIYFSIVQRNPTVQPTARRSSFREQGLCRSAAGTPRSGNWTRPAHVVGSTRCHHRRKPLMRSLQYERDQPDLSE
jgi:hypothetical protein